MAAYDLLINLIREYFVHLGYEKNYIDDYFSNNSFKEIISIRLANANLMIKNKTIRSSHQTHIAITGEAISFFYGDVEFEKMDTKTIYKIRSFVSSSNLLDLKQEPLTVNDDKNIELREAFVTVGKRTQKQLQLSKRNTENGEYFNELRLGLYEDDLLIMMKFRSQDAFLAIGIPTQFYLDYIPDYAERYETNTYLRLPLKR